MPQDGGNKDGHGGPVRFSAMRTLLVGTSTASWREWVREYRNSADLLLLSPSQAGYGFPARYAFLSQNGVQERFFGSLDPLRSPHVTVATAARFGKASQETMVLLGDLGKTALARQVTEAVVEAFQPEKILVPFGGHAWHPSAHETELASMPPPAVIQAQRRAHWIDLLERSHLHEFGFNDLRFQGTRLGSGVPVDVEGALHAEKIGSSLYAIVGGAFEDREVALALDRTGSSKAHLVTPETFRGLLCALVRANGTEAGVGIIERFDLESGTISVRSPAVPPLPIATLRIGALRLDREGNEIGELRPWAV
ncbi:hypothetical protein BH11ARM2_BH11ARM2_11830 [soil metagenome]